MDGSYHFALRITRPDKVVLTLFTFEMFKQCDQMVVAINNALFSQNIYKIENGSKKTFAIIPKSAKVANVFFRDDSQYTVCVTYI